MREDASNVDGSSFSRMHPILVIRAVLMHDVSRVPSRGWVDDPSFQLEGVQILLIMHASQSSGQAP